jgi:hypothetical protein
LYHILSTTFTHKIGGFGFIFIEYLSGSKSIFDVTP